MQIRLMLGAVHANLLEFEGFFGKVTCAFINLSCWINLDTRLTATVHKNSMKCSSHGGVLGGKKKSLACLGIDSAL